MSTINYTYNVIVDRFRQFAAGHFQLRRFTHGEISQADLEKEAEWPWLHVKPRAINYSPGTRSFSFEIFISDLPRDKEDKTGYQAESITDCSLIFQDLINEIYLGNMFGDQVVLSRPVNSEPFVEQYTHTLTGVTGIVELNLDYDWSACSIPASWNYNTPTDSPSDGWGALQFIESLDQNGVFVSLLNDVEAPGNSYYYGTNASGVKGWYAIVDNVGLTCETLPECATIISIVDDIAALQTDVALKANTADLGATAFSNDYDDLDNKPTIPSIAGLVPETRTLTINGTTQDLSADRTFTIATGLTVGTTPITSGTVGRVLFEGTGNVLQESANLFWDNTNSRLGIGTATPTNKLTINVGTIASQGVDALYLDADATSQAASTGIFFRLANSSGLMTGSIRTVITAANAVRGMQITSLSRDGIMFLTNATAPVETMRINASGNLLLNTTTDAGFKLDVNGTARMNSINGGGTSTLTVKSHVGATAALTVQFASNQSATSLDKPIISAVGTFNPSSGAATFAGLSFTATINQTGTATGISRGLYINPTLTAAVDFRAIETTAGNVLFGSNFFWDNTNGRLGIGTATPTHRVNVLGATGAGRDVIKFKSEFSYTGYLATTNSFVGLSTQANSGGSSILLSDANVNVVGASGIQFTTGGSERARFAITTGNFLIGTGTDAGYKLNVNGTARVSSSFRCEGQVTFTSAVIGTTIRLGSNPQAASSVLDVQSTTKGFLPPRMTTTQKNAIASPASGLVVYDTDLGKLCVRGASAWETITSV